MYMLGCTNYSSHKEAEAAFSKIECMSALRLMEDGTATITTLSLKPVQSGQIEFSLKGCKYQGPI